MNLPCGLIESAVELLECEEADGDLAAAFFASTVGSFECEELDGELAVVFFEFTGWLFEFEERYGEFNVFRSWRAPWAAKWDDFPFGPEEGRFGHWVSERQLTL